MHPTQVRRVPQDVVCMIWCRFVDFYSNPRGVFKNLKIQVDDGLTYKINIKLKQPKLTLKPPDPSLNKIVKKERKKKVPFNPDKNRKINEMFKPKTIATIPEQVPRMTQNVPTHQNQGRLRSQNLEIRNVLQSKTELTVNSPTTQPKAKLVGGVALSSQKIISSELTNTLITPGSTGLARMGAKSDK